jgi:hypothetical protein
MRVAFAFPLVFVVMFDTACAQERRPRREPNPVLFQDERLQTKLNVDRLNPDIHWLLEQLSQKTGASFTLDDNLQNHAPLLGSFQMGDAPAWMILNILEQQQLDNGRWLKDGNGYVLTGKSAVPNKTDDQPMIAARRPIPWLPISGVAVALIVTGFGVGFVLRRRRAKPAAQKKST